MSHANTTCSWHRLSKLAEVPLDRRLRFRLHRGAALLPVGGAHLAVLLHELKGLQQAQNLIHVAAHRHVVDGDLAHHTVGVDDEEAAVGHALLLLQHAVGTSDGLGLVSQHWDRHGAQTTLLAVLHRPLQVRVLAVHGARDDLAVQLVEATHVVRELNDLCGAHEGEVERVEEEYDPLALVVGQADLLEGAVGHERDLLEGRRGAVDLGLTAGHGWLVVARGRGGGGGGREQR
ncbi:tryparedoxin peroxidase [Leishmania tarentolae]|uniref:Tryparedoxin peroxidase n=1 Tax=Leishmania tarentolae TaxID=5689 RepID=A0A640KCJ8_LEITA|nr:tryparedoxin peroxidase [Leishmania tarentolae]